MIPILKTQPLNQNVMCKILANQEERMVGNYWLSEFWVQKNGISTIWLNNGNACYYLKALILEHTSFKRSSESLYDLTFSTCRMSSHFLLAYYLVNLS